MPFNNSVNANSAGFQSVTSAGVWNGRTLQQGTGITITNGDGTAGDPTISATGGSQVFVQQKRFSSASTLGTGSTIPGDDTIPQNSEGGEILTLAITPTNSSNILIFDYYGIWSLSGGNNAGIFAVFQDSTANAIFAGIDWQASGGQLVPQGYSFRFYMTAGTTSSTTFKLRIGAPTGSGQSMFINAFGTGLGTRIFGGASVTTFTITEVTP